jgi:fructokinase
MSSYQTKEINVVCFGEVLWDQFPDHKTIGGAPLNVALRLKSYNNQVALISAIGKDENGIKILEYLNQYEIDTSLVQTSENFDTGLVKVMLNPKGSASYDIKFPSAWDYIVIDDSVRSRIEKSDVFVYGSLVARGDTSRNTLLELLDHAKFKVFDLNLRAPYYTKDLLESLLKASDFIKFNDDELYEVAEMLGSKYRSLEQNISFMEDLTGAKSICVTKGRHGAVLLHRGQLYYNSGFHIQVKDTVGAGDSFLASLVDQLFHSVEPQKAINFACAVGAMVAESEGANPILDLTKIKHFINPYRNIHLGY